MYSVFVWPLGAVFTGTQAECKAYIGTLPKENLAYVYVENGAGDLVYQPKEESW
jgi:hypothetical protein